MLRTLNQPLPNFRLCSRAHGSPIAPLFGESFSAFRSMLELAMDAWNACDRPMADVMDRPMADVMDRHMADVDRFRADVMDQHDADVVGYGETAEADASVYSFYDNSCNACLVIILSRTKRQI